MTGRSSPGLLTVASLERTKGAAFSLAPDAGQRAAVAAGLGIDGLRKLTFKGEVRPEGKRDWRLTGQLGATVVQPCVVTLVPVVTRIDETVERLYLSDPAPEPEGGEVEMPEDDRQEPLGATIDVVAVMTEVLALALPAYPRAEGAMLDPDAEADPEEASGSDEGNRPFTALKALRDRLSDNEEN